MDSSLPGCFVHGILQARILEWVAISVSRGSSQHRNGTLVSCIAGRFSINWAMREPQQIAVERVNSLWKYNWWQSLLCYLTKEHQHMRQNLKNLKDKQVCSLVWDFNTLSVTDSSSRQKISNDVSTWPSLSCNQMGIPRILCLTTAEPMHTKFPPTGVLVNISATALDLC